MIGTLARKRTQVRLPRLLALALVAAVIGALAASSSPALAATGDVSANRGFCVQETAGQNGVVRATTATGGAAVTVDDGDGNNPAISCLAAYAGRPVTVTPNGTTSPMVTVLQPSLTISIDGYPDNVVPSRGLIEGLNDFTVRVTYNNLVRFTHTDDNMAVTSTAVGNNAPFQSSFAQRSTIDNSDNVRLAGVWVSRGLGVGFNYSPPTATNQWGRAHDLGGGAEGVAKNRSAYSPNSWYVPPGVTGEITLSATIDYDEYRQRTNGVRSLTATQVITVVDELPAALATSTLSLRPTADNPLTSADESGPGKDSASADGGELWLKLDSMDALGNPANRWRLSSATILAPGAGLTLYKANGTSQVATGSNSISVTGSKFVSSATTEPTTVDPTMVIKVTKADGKAGSVSVRAIVVGEGGSANTETVTLNFTGAAAQVVLGDDIMVGQPAENQQAQREISLGATDAGGNTVAPGTATFKVTDADGKDVAASMIMAEQDLAGSSTPDDASDNSAAPVVLVTVDDTAAPGVYTITASLTNVDDSSDSAMLTISGPAANLELSADKTTGETIGELITVTAMITDADGVAVADGTVVNFAVSGEGLFAIGEDVSADPGIQARTKAGAATAEFTVVGAGTSVISAVIGSQTEVVVVTSTAGMAAAMPEEEEDEEPSLSHLSRTSGLASYSGPETTASALYALLQARGATALWLSIDDEWVLYATVNGAMVPGSVDFSVTSGDVLYISN